MASSTKKSSGKTRRVRRRDVIAFLRSALDQRDSEIGETGTHLIRLTIECLEQEEMDIVFVDRG